MSDLNLQLVREFFELNRFHVLTHWQHEDLPRVSEPGCLLFVEHPNPDPGPEAGFLLRPEDLTSVHRAVVEVRAWHADRFYPSVVESSPVLAHVAGAEARALGESIFGCSDFTTILVISELPSSTGPRERSLALFKALGIGHILEFPTLLQDVLSRISAHGNYAPSQTLQTLRLLKRYQFIRRQQLELPFSTEAPTTPVPPVVPVQTTSEDIKEEDE